MDNPEAIGAIFAIVVGIVIIVALSTYTLAMYSRYYQCVNSTSVWCSDKWTCENNSDPSSGHNSCFNTATDPQGLASCLTGPSSLAANLCVDGECSCPNNFDSTPNCFSGCPTNLDNVTGSTACCCNVGEACTPC